MSVDRQQFDTGNETNTTEQALEANRPTTAYTGYLNPAYIDPSILQNSSPLATRPETNIETISGIIASTSDQRHELEITIRVCDDIANLVSQDFSRQSCTAFVRYQAAARFELLGIVNGHLSALSTLEVTGIEAVRFGDTVVAELEETRNRCIVGVRNLAAAMVRCGLNELAMELELRLQ